MSVTPLPPKHTGTPPFLKPYLRSHDRLQQRVTLQPKELTGWAQTLLVERCGPSRRGTESAFAHAAVGLINDHTHYFNGFALLKPLPHGTAVAIRPSRDAHSRLTFEGSETLWTFDRTQASSEVDRQERPVWTGVVTEVLRRMVESDMQVEVAVVSTIQAGCVEAYLAALGVATVRAVQAFFALPHNTMTLLDDLRQLVESCIQMPFSRAHLIAAEVGVPTTFTLIDTDTGESLQVEAPLPDALGWGLVDVGGGYLHEAAAYRERKDKADQVLIHLRKHGFGQLGSLRELEHRDLQRALDAVPRRLGGVVRHLVTENRRVQRLVVATRRGDWQMLGALLLMSHASLRDDWQCTNDEVNYVVGQVEAMSLEGMYGASVTGRGSCVLVVGQPYVVPLCLDRIAASFATRFGRTPETLLL